MAGPAHRFAAVTPSNSTNLPGGIAAALYIGVAGDVAIVGADDNNGEVVEVFKNVANGTILPVYCKRVNSTSTTATFIKALYL